MEGVGRGVILDIPESACSDWGRQLMVWLRFETEISKIWSKIEISSKDFFFRWLYSPLGPWPLIFRFYDHFTDGKTP
jgi:hypothetical protein